MPTSTAPSLTSISPSPSPSPIPRSGILTTPTGDRHIPPSTRADGSLRKEIKIRPGYRPPEDVEVYKNRTAEAWKTRGTGGVPGAESLKGSSGEEKLGGSAGKNAKRREARKKAKASETGDEGGEQQPNGDMEARKQQQSTAKSKAEAVESWRVAAKNPEQELDAGAEKEKQARNLKKKLRQARELREKKDKGGILLPEQFEKIIKIQELIRQLDNLGIDADGEKKPKSV